MYYQTLGHASAANQQDPRVIEAALRSIDVTEPAMVLNDKRYYRLSDICDAVAVLIKMDQEDKAKADAKKQA